MTLSSPAPGRPCGPRRAGRGGGLEAKIGGGPEFKKPSQGLNFGTMKVEAKSKDLELMVDEIAAKATAPT